MVPHSSALAWNIPPREEPCRLQSMGSLRVGHDWATSLSLFTLTPWRREWQPTPVFLPGESQGRGSLVGCRPWGRTESATTEATWQQQQQQQHSAINYYNHQDAHQLSTIYSSSTWKFYSLSNIALFPWLSGPAAASLVSVSMSSSLFCFFLVFTCKWSHRVFVCLCLTYPVVWCSQVSSVFSQMARFPF